MVMADKGFLISDLLTPKGVALVIPPFKRKNRIHVEREMERIKNV